MALIFIGGIGFFVWGDLKEHKLHIRKYALHTKIVLITSLILIIGPSILFLILVMAVYVFTFPAYRAEQVMTVFFGFFYVAVMLSFVYQTRMLADGA